MKRVPGILPNPAWLERNGYGRLKDVIREHPEPFAHIRQDRRVFRSPQDWVLVAEELARKNGGILPTHRELLRRGYRTLLAAMERYPRLFAHIKRMAPSRLVQEELVALARRLVAENEGTLPSPMQLRQSGHTRLARALHCYPAWFADIQRKRRPRRQRCELAAGHFSETASTRKNLTLDEWMQFARHLVTTQGALPANSWLKKNGYQGLRHAIREHPRHFARFPRLKNSRVDKTTWFLSWVPFAKKLAQEHRGRLPGDRWLTRHNYQGLILAKQQHPELFAEVAG